MSLKKALEILNLHEGFTEDELKEQYKNLARRYHPDNGNLGDEQRFIEVKDAYDVLRDYLNSKGTDDSDNGDICCPRCQGKGKVNEKCRGSRGIMIIRVDCPMCKGTGKTI